MKLFEVAIIYQGKKARKEGEDEGDAKLLVEPKWVMAKSDKVASMKVLREAQLDDTIDFERVEVLVRPFN